MIIQRIHENSKLCYGINWMSDRMTFFSVKFVLPIWLMKAKEYEDFDTSSFRYGKRVKVLFLRFRIRRWKHFGKDIRKVLYSYSTDFWAFGKQTLISTEEQRLDESLKMLQDIN